MSKRRQTKIDPREFLNTAKELHALVIGWAEIVCPWPPLHRKIGRRNAEDLSREYHYYQLGRALGIFTWLGIAAVIKGVFL